ncbi:uncharacterized protein [Blastocystis hominis]|uniref:Prolyl endopeptidase n=1 Tax=Blastocystis hominis TaxID=12968 RepID=D8M4G7_BLAHO|nr:uncharacterized protein [Blastocystis hominis]CBK22956.2 unnamed protein product [Blastocystis hominis]|eukprot:XP_012897004.1 uncharacterized protein [Blastocystis hominis]
MFSPFPQLVRSSRWDNIQKIVPALHGKGKDKFKWMETFNQNTSSRLYLKAVINSCGNVKQLQKELLSFQDDGPSESLPYTLHGYKYYNRKTRSDFLPLFCRKKVGSDVEEVILNLDKEFPEGEDSRYLAYTIDTTGEELYNLYIKDLSTGQVEMIQRNVYSFSFGLSQGASRDIYYTVANNLMRTNRVYRHVLGSSATHDVPVFEEPSAVYYCDVKRTNDCKFMLFFSASKSDSEIFLQRPGRDSPVRLVQRRAQEECYVEHIQKFFIVVRSSALKAFQVFLVHEDDVFAGESDVFAGKSAQAADAKGLIDRCFEQGKVVQLTPSAPSASSASSASIASSHSALIPDAYRIFDMDILKSCHGFRIRSLQLDLYDNNLSISEQLFPINHIGEITIEANPDIDSKTILYTLSNPLIRGNTYEYDITRNTSKLVRQIDLPSDFGLHLDSFDISSQIVPSFDGQEIPTIFVIPKKAAKNAPVLLSSYGCYGVDNPIHYAYQNLSLLKRGWILGGGGDKGPQWYQQGCRTNRRNGIRDLDSVVGAWCEDHPVCLTSNSAGGILTGALLNETNHRVSSVILHVPFLLLEETLTNRGLPLTVTEFDEWGDPSVPEEALAISQICPYKNIRKRDYPNIYCICGLNDKRAPYYHSLKYINKIREFNSNPDSVQVLEEEMKRRYGGHFCENDPNYSLTCSTQQLAFLIHSVGGVI